jgi:hypothetical protein
MIILIVMFTVLTGTLWFLDRTRKDAERAWARPLMAVSAVILLGCIVMYFKVSGTSDRTEEFLDTYTQEQATLGLTLGMSLAERHPGARVTVLQSWLYDAEGHRMLIENLTRSLEGSDASVRVLTVDNQGRPVQQSDQDSQDADPVVEEDHLVDLETFLSLLDELDAETDLVVSTIPVPPGLDASTLPPKGEGPMLVLILPSSLDHTNALRETILDAVVLPRYDPEARTPAQYQLVVADQ